MNLRTRLFLADVSALALIAAGVALAVAVHYLPGV